MILFDYECKRCLRVEECLVERPDDPVFCIVCGVAMTKLFTARGTGLDWFKPGYFEHITDRPVFVESKKQLKQECEKHGCYSVALLNENKRTGASQEIQHNRERCSKKEKAKKEVERIADDCYRRVFGD